MGLWGIQKSKKKGKEKKKDLKRKIRKAFQLMNSRSSLTGGFCLKTRSDFAGKPVGPSSTAAWRPAA